MSEATQPSRKVSIAVIFAALFGLAAHVDIDLHDSDNDGFDSLASLEVGSEVLGRRLEVLGLEDANQPIAF